MVSKLPIFAVFLSVLLFTAVGETDEKRDALVREHFGDMMNHWLSIPVGTDRHFQDAGPKERYQAIEKLKDDFVTCFIDTVRSYPELNPDVLLAHFTEGATDSHIKAAYEAANGGKDIVGYADRIRAIAKYCDQFALDEMEQWKNQ